MMDVAKLIDEFFSRQFSQTVLRGCEWNYGISASYCSLLFSTGIRGILYASVGSNGAGLNVVFDKSVVDDETLMPKQA